MSYISFNFLIFFPILTLLFWMTPAKYKWLTLLAASYFFYINMKPVYALLIFGITASTYVFTRLIDNTKIESRKKIYMIINIVLILLPLFFFKYFNSFNEGVFEILKSLNIRWPLPEIKFFLPVGISFYTFMAIGYTVDVYNEEIDPEKNIGILALFISFFPLILSGPIERAKNMLPQFKTFRKLDYTMVIQGVKLILWGYFMKLVVADRVGIYIDTILNNIDNHNGTSILFASFLYPFQVYADLGGYSLIAIGSAKMLGINVIQNFNRPFFSTSISELWHRWHISLISWLTDYIYTPLSFAFRRFKIMGIVLAIMITFLISGIWHGAALTFIVWGLIQGIGLSIEALLNKRKILFEKKYILKDKGWYIFFCVFLTFLIFSGSLVFGKAPNIDLALLVFSKIFSSSGNLFIGEPTIFLLSILSVSIMLSKDFLDEYYPSRINLFNSPNLFVRLLSYGSVLIIILAFGVFDGGQFIYFQF
jgi:alginate O-acetyltransferase complex protein AlgI